MLKNQRKLTWLLAKWLVMLVAGLLSPAIYADEVMVVEITFEDRKFGERVRGLLGDEQLDNIKNSMSLLGAIENGTTDPVYLKRLYDKAPEEIRTALRPYGYYSPDIDSSIDLDASPPRTEFTIARGEPVKVSRVRVELVGDGKDDEILQTVKTEFPLKKGDRLVHANYEAGKQRMLNTLQSRGYFDAQTATRKIIVDPAALTAEIQLQFQTGPRYRFGEIDIEGNHLNPRVVEKFVRFEEDEFYSQDKLFGSQNALSTSPWYAYADVEAMRDKRDGERVPVVVNIVPSKQHAYSTGIGYGTDTGARVSVGYERRWLNDDGVSMETELDYAELRRTAKMTFRRPAFSSRLNRYSLGFRYTDETTDTSTSTANELAFTQEGRWRGWTDTLGLVLRDDRFEIGDTRDETFLIMPTAQLSRTRADNLLFPREGYSLSLQLRGASEMLASDLDFLQFAVYGRAVLPAFEQDRLLFRLHLGTTWTPEFNQLPPDLRFLTGGDRSVRGFGYERLGPRDNDGDVIGGRNLIVGSAEYEYRFDQQWAAAGFVDVGNAFNDVDDVRETDLFEGSVGAGARWLSPVGMIRLDLAVVVTEDDYPVRLHFTLGPDL